MLRIGTHTNNGKWRNDYKSVFLLGSASKARIEDALALPANAADHDVIMQNLRLIAGPGKNVWSKTDRAWSEAALAMDDQGRILFLFCRTPLSMWAFNQRLLRSGLGITHAQHLEGGPEASLTIRTKRIQLDLSGSYESSFNENDDNALQWRLPNVLVVPGS